jgi:hypothetical protein
MVREERDVSDETRIREAEARHEQRAALRERLVRELRAGFLEDNRALATNVAQNVADIIIELVQLEAIGAAHVARIQERSTMPVEGGYRR